MLTKTIESDESWRRERGRLLKEARKARQMTQLGLATAAEIHQSQVSDIERAKMGDRVAAETIHRIERVLKLPHGYLMPPAQKRPDERSASLERFLRSPWAEGIKDDEVDFLNGILSNMAADYPIVDHAWYLFLQGYRLIASGRLTDSGPLTA